MSEADFESKMKYKISGIEKRREQREENINKVFFSSKSRFLYKSVYCLAHVDDRASSWHLRKDSCVLLRGNPCQ